MRLRASVWIAAILACITVSPANASTFTDGEFYTWDQNAWGADPGDGLPASLLVAPSFFSVGPHAFEVGYVGGFDPDKHFLLPDVAAVPGPPGLALMLCGLGLLAVGRRSRGCAAVSTENLNARILQKPIVASLVVCAVALLGPSVAAAQTQYTVTPLAQKKIKELPPGPLYWRVETFPTLADAKAVVGPDGWNPALVRYETTTSLIAELAGKVWVLTLGPMGAATPGGSKVAEIGPVPTITAPEYLLRVNAGSGPPGSATPVHSHPGSEAFYVITGELGQKTPGGVIRVAAGQGVNGHDAGMAMQVFNSGTTDLTALIMFVVDASKPFSEPAKLE